MNERCESCDSKQCCKCKKTEFPGLFLFQLIVIGLLLYFCFPFVLLVFKLIGATLGFFAALFGMF